MICQAIHLHPPKTNHCRSAAVVDRLQISVTVVPVWSQLRLQTKERVEMPPPPRRGSTLDPRGGGQYSEGVKSARLCHQFVIAVTPVWIVPHDAPRMRQTDCSGCRDYVSRDGISDPAGDCEASDLCGFIGVIIDLERSASVQLPWLCD